MIENLSNFCISIICTIMMIVLLEMIIPEGKNKKYITFICGIVVTLVLLEPIIDLLDIDIDEVLANSEYEYEEYNYDENLYDETLKKSYEEILINDITSRLKENGYNASNIKVEYDEDTFEPQKIYLDIEAEGGVVQPIKIEISKNESSNLSEYTKNKIKNIISENYGIKRENIFIGSEK